MQLAEGIFSVPTFLTPDECERHISAAKVAGFEPATIASSSGAVREPLIRNNDRIITDDEALSAAIWARLASHVPRFMNGRQAWGLNERWRFYRYHPGQQFAGHVDAPFVRANGEKSLLTLLLYLNDDFEGGETTFSDLVIQPELGMALLFRHELFHGGRPLLRGTKYVLTPGSTSCSRRRPPLERGAGWSQQRSPIAGGRPSCASRQSSLARGHAAGTTTCCCIIWTIGGLSTGSAQRMNDRFAPVLLTRNQFRTPVVGRNAASRTPVRTATSDIARSATPSTRSQT